MLLLTAKVCENVYGHLHERDERTKSSEGEAEEEGYGKNSTTSNALEQKRHPVEWERWSRVHACKDNLTDSPNERQASIPFTIFLQCVDNGRRVHPLPFLHSKHSRKDEYTTHETDNVVKKRCHAAQLDCTLSPSHERGIC